MTGVQEAVPIEAVRHRPEQHAVVVTELRKEFRIHDRKKGRFGRKIRIALEDVTFAIERGETVAILGQNGSGKSTLVRLLSTLLLPDGGSARIFGHDISDTRAVRTMVNRVSAEASFFKKLSALENLMYAARLYDLPAAEARERSIYILRKLGLGEKRLYEPLEQMSRGMQQKVAIARGLLTAPVLLLLDEPTTGLDPRSKQDVQRFILRMRREHETTVFLTTHDMVTADELCDRVAFLVDGQIASLDTPRSLRRRHGRQIVRVETMIDGTRASHEFPLAGLADNSAFLSKLRSGQVETLHTLETTLEDVLVQVTGRPLA